MSDLLLARVCFTSDSTLANFTEAHITPLLEPGQCRQRIGQLPFLHGLGEFTLLSEARQLSQSSTLGKMAT